MAAAGGIRAGRAFVELFADDRALVRGLRSAQRRLAAFGAAVRGMGAGFAALGAGLVAPLALAARSFAQTGSRLTDLAARTGLSVEALSELEFAAQQSGGTLDNVEARVRVMQRTIAAAAVGSDTAATALARLGTSAAVLSSLSPEEQFDALATALRGIADPTTRAAAAMAVFGRSGTALLPMIADMAALRAEARRLGVVLSTKQAKAADDLGDAYDRVRASVRGVGNAIGQALAPILTTLAGDIVRMLVGLREWIARNQGLVVTLATVGTAITGAGIGLILLGAAASAGATVLGGLTTIIAGVASAVVALATTLWALLTPITGVIVGAVALGAWLTTTSQTGQQALALLGDGFRVLQDDAVTAWGGIADALAAGDIGAAASIVWAVLKLEWQRGTSFLLDLWDSAVAGMAQVFTHTWFGLQETFLTVVHAIANAWDGLVAGLTSLWNTAVGAIAGKLAELLQLVGLADEGVELRIAEETTRSNADISQERDQRSASRAQEIGDIGQQREQTLAFIGEDLVEKVQDRDSGVAQARAELDAARAAARQRRTEVQDRVDGTTPANAAIPDLDGLRLSLDQIPETVTSESEKLDVSGAFSTAAISQIGIGGSAGERTAKATEETAKNTTRIARALEDSDPTFG